MEPKLAPIRKKMMQVKNTSQFSADKSQLCCNILRRDQSRYFFLQRTFQIIETVISIIDDLQFLSPFTVSSLIICFGLPLRCSVWCPYNLPELVCPKTSLLTLVKNF
jgi:hypothetical protein